MKKIAQIIQKYLRYVKNFVTFAKSQCLNITKYVSNLNDAGQKRVFHANKSFMQDGK